VSRRARVTAAYPDVEFRRATLTFLAQIFRALPECAHLDRRHAWAATISPDILYLRGKTRRIADPPRPEISLCRDCAIAILERELDTYHGRVVAFEPEGEIVTQYFFVPREDFEAAGLLPELSEAIRRRLAKIGGTCEECSAPAGWLWFSREEVQSLDDVGSVSAAPGRSLCTRHGTDALCTALEKIEQVNLLYVNIPFGEAGAYVWI
jgi:hypothetical protein